MTVANPLFALIIFLISFTTAYLIGRNVKLPNEPQRYETIDGWRGFLAIGVFIHHAFIWHQYLQVGQWLSPEPLFYNHLGATSVAFFFMITSFLFVTKLLSTDNKPFDWKRFFIARLFRLVPMYYFTLTVILVFVMIVTGWHLHVGFADLSKSIGHWMLFTIFGMPPINGFGFTSNINAGVAWSLPFEWAFYFALPLIAIFLLKKKPPVIVLAISICFIGIFIYHYGVNIYHIISFASGAIAPFLLKYTKLGKTADKPIISVAVIACFLLMTIIQKAYVDKLMIAIIFTLIALGNSVFGLLKNSTLKFMGEISYSTYLLHGIILFTAIYFVGGIENVKKLPETYYCLLIFGLTPIVTICSFLGFKWIEKPFMDWGRKIS